MAAAVFVGSRLPDSGTLSGGTVLFRHQEEADDDFSVASAAVTVSGVSPDPAAAYEGTAPNTFVFSAQVDDVPHGQYAVKWRIVTTDGVALVRREDYLVTLTDMRHRVRSRLGLDEDELPSEDIDGAALAALAALLSPSAFGGSLASYSDITEPDGYNFDGGLALLVAASMRPAQQLPDGPLVSMQIGTDAFKWAAGAAGRSQGDLWVDEAWQMLEATSVLGPAIRAMRDEAPQPLVPSGRRRSIALLTRCQWPRRLW